MPRVAIPVTEITRAGVAMDTVTQVTADPANDHSVAGGADALTILIVENTHATLARSASIPPNPALTVDGLTVGSQTIGPVPALKTFVCGVYRTNTFKQDVSNTLWVDVAEADLKFRAFRVVPPT